ncbi:MAG TPA: hypothetical protein VIP51_10230 [Eoetvoesiella sp.]
MYADQAQQAHGHAGQLANQVVAVELARGHFLRPYVCLKVGIELLIGAVLAVHGDLRRRNAPGQTGAPALHGAVVQRPERSGGDADDDRCDGGESRGGEAGARGVDTHGR